MRINLNDFRDAEGVTVQERLDESSIIVDEAVNVIGYPVLYPAQDDDGDPIAGVYEVWFPAIDPDIEALGPQFVYANADGEIVFMDQMPNAASAEGFAP